MNKPVLGMKAMKKRVGAENRPLFGSIVKKSGLNEEQLQFLGEQMIDGGTDFIKANEITNNSYFYLKD